MPYDPDTFKNLYPYPDRGIIRQTIQDKILCGELKLPSDRMLDSKEWIEEQTKKEYNHQRNSWEESEWEANKAWQKHQEKERGFENLPDNLKQKIHSQVWEDGHSGGYGEMVNRYIDLVPLVVQAYEVGYSVGAHDNR
ncbi:MAG: hypothetical protein FMNOHCHN_03665 [Ignavibacteriaceae bacterium]|nr:hypothetical protein [Ignavibacteriaceae bacterium]